MLRFPGVPAPRPGPLRRGDLVYLQSLRMALHADMRDAEGLCLRRVALVLCVLLAAGGVWQGVVLLGDSSSGPGGHLPAPRIAEACLQVLVWLTAAALLALEGTKADGTTKHSKLAVFYIDPEIRTDSYNKPKAIIRVFDPTGGALSQIWWVSTMK